MFLHFYTTMDELEKLMTERTCVMWTKDNAREYDIHVSIPALGSVLEPLGRGMWQVEIYEDVFKKMVNACE